MLLDALRKQVEYYFSQQNLQSDAYLTSQMDANMTCPIAVVMKFSKIKTLTEDEAVLRKALELSSLTVVDDRIKANLKAVGRSTIILREIPADATEDEVKEIFAFDGCKPITSMRSDVGDTWFVVMDSEEDAKDTLIDLKLKKRTFRGLWIQRINAAVRFHDDKLTYSRFIDGLTKAGVAVDRKVMADLAMNQPEAFKGLVDKARSALA